MERRVILPHTGKSLVITWDENCQLCAGKGEFAYVWPSGLVRHAPCSCRSAREEARPSFLCHDHQMLMDQCGCEEKLCPCGLPLVFDGSCKTCPTCEATQAEQSAEKREREQLLETLSAAAEGVVKLYQSKGCSVDMKEGWTFCGVKAPEVRILFKNPDMTWAISVSRVR